MIKPKTHAGQSQELFFYIKCRCGKYISVIESSGLGQKLWKDKVLLPDLKLTSTCLPKKLLNVIKFRA